MIINGINNFIGTVFNLKSFLTADEYVTAFRKDYLV